MQGFPKDAIATVCCTNDGGELELQPHWESGDGGRSVRDGSLLCRICGTSFTIRDGILNLLDAFALDSESQHERELRARQYSPVLTANETVSWENNEMERMEMDPTIDALSPEGSLNLLELGCGDGRMTSSLVRCFKSILAVDFSVEALQRLQRLPVDLTNVALVNADISTLKVRPKSFERILSTLTSNLPTPQHRESMYRLAGTALAPRGRFVFSTHNHGFWQRIHRQKKSDRYEEGGIFRNNLTPRDCRSEARRHFKTVKAWPVQISLPLSRRSGLPAYSVSRALEHVKPLGYFGRIVLCSAEDPLR
jgi:cyclopropane fatty-acyl-phospholipid synthase-like methyltransferase